MFKTFSTGVILGVIAAGAAAEFVPLFDLQREPSIIAVQPNGGNAEVFGIELPTDRILAANGEGAATPAGLEWPAASVIRGTGIELFKIRNSKRRVVGVASRITMDSPQQSPSVEWTLYLPARGALYVPMPGITDGGRTGGVRAGTREFELRRGQVTEVYLADSGSETDGRIELRATLVATSNGDAEDKAP